MSISFNKLCLNSNNDFIFGSAPNPIKCKNGMVIGGGNVYPELNFTLPPMNIDDTTYPAAKDIYRQMIKGALERAHELSAPGVVVEVELLPPMTLNPKWGIEITKIVRDIMFDFEANKGLKSVMRLTPNDTREFRRPPVMRSGELLDSMLQTFEGAARAGADFLSIESTGGKEINDNALINANLGQVVFALGVLGARDMDFLWKKIVAIAEANGSIAAGDSACGFGNTAMVLAEKGMLPGIFSAVVRVATVSRALVAFEAGAKGPSKDCAYEGPYLKAIAGVPIAMEGKSAACAHLSPVGNVAACVADMWSNESVQNVKLLADMAPTVSMEQLIYDCRLMNTAKKDGADSALMLQKWLADSDSVLSPQAYVLRPDVVLDISRILVTEPDPYRRTKLGSIAAVNTLRKAVGDKEIIVNPREARWLDIMEDQLNELPDTAEGCWAVMKKELDLTKFIPSEYGLE
jgi:methanol---5-hydroxybenzimidazolylcobamide Co-methyltransferase